MVFLAVRFNFSSKVVRCGTKRKSLGWDILGVFPIRGSKVWCRRLRLFTRERLSLWFQIFNAQLLRNLAAIVVLNNLVAYRDRLA